MNYHKLTEIDEKKVQKIYQSFLAHYPGPDDDPKLSGICEIIISPFDHWLSEEEAALNIRSFCENPSAAQLEKFAQNETKNLNFLKQYLTSRLFYHLSNWDFTDDDSQGDSKKSYPFYSCPSVDNFYDLVNDSYQPMIFLPQENVRVWLNDTNCIHFELIKGSQQEINNIVNLANACGLYVNHNGYLTWQQI